MAVFFITFLPQFVSSQENAMAELFVMGNFYAVLSILWFVFYVFCLTYIREWLMSATVQSYMEKLTGIVLIGFGIKLLFTQHKNRLLKLPQLKTQPIYVRLRLALKNHIRNEV